MKLQNDNEWTFNYRCPTDGDKDKNNTLISFCIDDVKLSEKPRTIWTKIENLKKHWTESLTSLYDRYIKNKVKTYTDKVYTNFFG